MKFSIFNILILLLAVSCTEEQDFPFNQNAPIPVTLNFQELNENGVTLRGELIVPPNLEILSYGFIWETNGLKFTKSFTDTHEGPYAYRINSDLKRGFPVEYRAFAKTQQTTFVGKALTFSPEGVLPPLITGYQPEIVKRGDQVIMFVDNLSNIDSRNVVYLNGEAVETTRISDNSLEFTIPPFLSGTSLQVRVKSGELYSEVNEDLTLVGPILESISSSNVRPMDVITVYSPEFNIADGTKVVSLEGGSQLITLEEGPGYAKIAIPDKPGTYKLYLEVNHYTGDPELAPTITINELWQDAGSIYGGHIPEYFDYQGELYSSDNRSDKILKVDPNTLSRTVAATIVPAANQWLLPGRDVLRRVRRDDQDNYQLTEIDLTSGTETFTKVLNYNQNTEFKTVTIGNTGYFVAPDNSVYKLDLISSNFERVADFPEAINEAYPNNLGENFYPYEEDGKLHIFTTYITFVYDEAEDIWKTKSTYLKNDQIIYSVFRHNNILYCFMREGMFRWYDEFEKWVLISTKFGYVNGHYDNNGLHVINFSSVKRMLP